MSAVQTFPSKRELRKKVEANNAAAQAGIPPIDLAIKGAIASLGITPYFEIALPRLELTPVG